MAKRQSGGGDAAVAEETNGMMDFELWNVTVKEEWKLNEQMNKVKIQTPVKKGTEPVRIARIEQRHADVLNAQFANTNQYYYLKTTDNGN